MADTSNAVILERVEAGNNRLDRVIVQLDDMNGCLRDVQINQATYRSEINALTKDQEDMKKAGLRQDGIVGGVLFGFMLAKDKIADLF